MRNKLASRLGPSLVGGCGALFFACAPGPVDTKYGTPQVNNIYAIDLDNGLPAVLIYSNPAASGSDPRVTPTPPAAYSAFQVEFDQPMSSPTLSSSLDRAAKAGGTSTFCDPSGAGIQLIDVDAGNLPIQSSVCYDPSSPIGSNPHATVIPGSGLSAGAPFTCQTFSRATTSKTAPGVFAENHKYALKFNSGIQSASGQTLQTPSDPGWASGQYTFTTSGMALMAAGFQDPVSNYYTWLQKPFTGFMKDLNEAGKAGPNKATASCSVDSDCQLTQSAAPGSPAGEFGQVCAAGVCAFRQQVFTYGGAQTPTPFLIFTTDQVDKTTLGGITVSRAGTDVSAVFTVDLSFDSDSRVITVTPAATWESGATYTINVPATVGATGGTTLGTAKSFTFVAAPADIAALQPPTPDENSTGNAVGSTTVQVTYTAPLVLGPAAKVQLLQGATVIPIKTPVLDPTTNNQIVTLAPSGTLDAGTVYTVSITGLTTATGQPVKDYSYNFTSAFFNATDITTGGKSILRSTKAPVTALQDGVTVVYSEAFDPTTLSSSTVKVFENTPTGTPLSATVTPVAGKSNQATVTVSGASKFGQRYVIQSTTGLKSARGASLVAEGCLPGTGADCSDNKAFTTVAFSGTLGAPTKVADVTAGKFTFTFNNPIDPTTLPALPSGGAPKPGDSVQLFKQDASGSRSAVPITCSLDATSTIITCTAVTPLFNNTAATSNVTYIASVGFAAPGVKSTSATSAGKAVVPATFTGGATSTFVTPCFP